MKLARFLTIMLTLTGVGLYMMQCCSIDPNDNIHNTDYSAKGTFAFQAGTQGKKSLKLDGIAGDITIVGSTTDSMIYISGVRIVQTESEEDAAEHLQDLQVQVSVSGQDIIIKTVQPDQAHGRSYLVHYDIKCPAALAVDIESITGQTTIASMHNRVSMDLVNGNLVTTDIQGNMNLTVTNGCVDSELILAAGGNAEITTVNGLVRLRIPDNTSAEISASVTNGRVSVTDVAIQYITKSTRFIRGTLGDGNGQITLRSTNGDIHLEKIES